VDTDSIDFNVVVEFGHFGVATAVPGSGPGRDVPVARHVRMTGDVNSGRFEQIVHTAAILQQGLHTQIVEDERLAQLHVLLGFGEWIPLAEKGNKDWENAKET